ncbi:MAG: hypothetical protein ACYS0C_00640 [Planctomycetota bacterium]
MENDITKSQSVPTNVQEKSHFEDEINLMDYLRVLWKWKNLILLGSVLPALLVGLILFSWPRKYRLTYVYSNLNLNNKDYYMFLNRFYGVENMRKLTTKLEENGLNEYAKQIKKVQGKEGLKGFIGFQTLQPYEELIKSKNIAITVTDPAKLGEIMQLKAQLLNMTIIARPKEDIPIIASVVRDNLENLIPVYLVEEELNTTATEWRAKMASIEENRFHLELDLKTNRSILAKLKNIKAGTSDKNESQVTLQFDGDSKGEYLPLGYQIQAAVSKIVQLEENIRADEEKYNYYKDLLALNGKLSTELKDKASSHYTIKQFHSFLTVLIDNYNNKKLKGYLNSYIKKIENKISASAPFTEKPEVYAIPRGTGKKTTIVFAISLMISMFAALLFEGAQKSQAQAS